jgi:serine/threonine protein kinase
MQIGTSPMNPQERHRRVREIFDAVRLLPDDERAAYLDEACGQDDDLRAETAALVKVLSTAGKFLESNRGIGEDRLFRPPSRSDVVSSPPTQFGQYRIVDVIGRGAMGVVYRATQENPDRDVALKVVRAGLVSSRVLRRFELEATILGRLQHACIAQIYEAGSFGINGHSQPFFAMEIIDGQPIDQYVSSQTLDLRSLVELVIRICEGVEHAHRRGIIHRDLKPANIMVTRDGEPKILDFGVARTIESDVNMTSMHTDIGQLVGTLPYMSPEQVVGDPDDLDTRSDVYALGVLSFELLTGGERPQVFESMSVPEAIRTICDEESRSLSSVSRRYRGDLDTIIGKALHKDRNRRYQSAGEFAADLIRYLNNQPITARPPSISYQIGKFAARHSGLVAGLILAGVLLITGSAVSITQAVRATGEANKLRAVNTYFERVVAAPDPWSEEIGYASPRTMTMAEALDRAGKDLSNVYARQPIVESSLRHTLGSVYRNIGDLAKAEKHLTRARELRERELGRSHPDTLRTLLALASVMRIQSRLDESESVVRYALTEFERINGTNDVETISCRFSLALTLRDLMRFEDAVTEINKAIRGRTSIYGAESVRVLESQLTLASIYYSSGRFNDAIDLYSTVGERLRQKLGPEHPQSLIADFGRARSLYRSGQYEEAEPVLRATLQVQRRVLGDSHWATMSTINTLGVMMIEMQRMEEARTLLDENLRLCELHFGTEHRQTLLALHNLASMYRESGAHEHARDFSIRVIALQRELLGRHVDLAYSLNALGLTYIMMDEHESAVEPLREALDIRTELNGLKDVDTVITLWNLARAHRGLDEIETAADYYSQAMTIGEEVLDQSKYIVLLNSYAGLLFKKEQFVDAEKVYARCVKLHEEIRGNDFFGTAIVRSHHARALIQLQRLAEARSTLEIARTTMDQSFSDQHPYYRLMAKAFAELHEAEGHAEGATYWRRIERGENEK